MKTNYQHVGIVGAGAMGRGIAQIAAQAGSQVHLFDVHAAAVQQAYAAVLGNGTSCWKRAGSMPPSTKPTSPACSPPPRWPNWPRVGW